MFNKIYLRSLFLFSLLLFATNIYAIPIVGSASGTFVNPVGSSQMVVSGVGTNSFSWGSGNLPSSLTFTGNSFSGNSDDIFSFGTLNYLNGSTDNNTEATDVDLNVTLAFSNLGGVTKDFLYSLSLVNTPNNGSSAQNADYVYLPSILPETFFSAGGVDYTLEFLGFGIIDTIFGFTSINNFYVFEDSSESAQILGRITVSAASTVPEPSTLILMVLGLIGLRVSLRKKG